MQKTKKEIDPVDKLERSLLGKIRSKKGRVNEDRSVQYILDNPKKYMVSTKSGIEVAKTAFRGKSNIDFFGLFDIITIPDLYSYREKGDGIPHIYLIQVKTNKVPDVKYLYSLYNFNCPFYVKKELHIWMDGEDKPKIIDLND